LQRHPESSAEDVRGSPWREIESAARGEVEPERDKIEAQTEPWCG
jgi:hypothetical protein